MTPLRKKMLEDSRDGSTVFFFRREYLVPVKALSVLFRAKFISMLKKVLPDKTMPPVTRQKGWVVFCKHLDLGPEKVIQYLGRYLNRVAINDARVRRLPDGDVLVRYRNEDRIKSVRLSPHEFLRRYLQHVLPKGLNKVRRYGLFSPGRVTALKALRYQLLLTAKTKVAVLTALAAAVRTDEKQHWPRCPQCGLGIMKRVLSLLADDRNRSPPSEAAALA